MPCSTSGTSTCEATIAYDKALVLQQFVEEHGIANLNVADSRESKEPGIYQWVTRVLEDAFFRSGSHPGVIGDSGDGRTGEGEVTRGVNLSENLSCE
jgi:hypothetical protein